MKKIILLIAGFCVFCLGVLNAQTPVKGVTVTGAYETMRTEESTPRFVSPTGELYTYPIMSNAGQILNVAELSLSSTASNGVAYICGSTPAAVTYTATTSIETGYTFSWTPSGGTISNGGRSYTMSYNTAGSKTVQCVITGNGVSGAKSISIMVEAAGTIPVFATCEQGLSVTIKCATNVDTLRWGDNSYTVNPSADASHEYSTAGLYDITAVSNQGCKAVKTVGINTTLHPCTVTVAHTDASVYTGTSPLNPGVGGLETETEIGSNIITQVTDQDGNVYPVVQIGSQCWMGKNLRTTHYDASHSVSYSSTSYSDIYGLYYSLIAATNNSTTEGCKGICPKGWHLPKDEEWTTMEESVNGGTRPGDYSWGSHAGKLSAGCNWEDNQVEATPGNYCYSERNSSGFGALPAGSADGQGLNSEAVFWGSTFDNNANGVIRLIREDDASVWSIYVDKSDEMSVRCVRDFILDLSTVTENTTVPDGWTVTGTLGRNVKISIADGATVTLDNVNINGSGTWTSGDYAGITCEGDATIVLSGTNSVRGFSHFYPGIQAGPSDKTLTILGDGSLNASSNGYATGIGCCYGYDRGDCGNIVITGGTITATGGDYAAGIGGGNNNKCGDITISGGNVTAYGGSSCSGIGAGFQSVAECGDITISGGTVKAYGGFRSAGIGAGQGESKCGNIVITGGTITATGGDSAAGIGAGYSSICGNITINGGTITATSGTDGLAAVGKGFTSATCGDITISGTPSVTLNNPKNTEYPVSIKTFLNTENTIFFDCLEIQPGGSLQFSYNSFDSEPITFICGTNKFGCTSPSQFKYAPVSE